MKHILTSLFLILSLSLFAQTDSVKQSEHYFEFTAVSKGLFEEGYGFNFNIIFGKKYLDTDSLTSIKMAIKIKSFRKVEDVLEYLNARGWKLVSAYATSFKYYHTFYYIMKKEIN